MTYNPNAISNMWDYEDFVRRATQALFDPTLPEIEKERHEVYRRCLLMIMDGMLYDDYDAVASATNVLNQMMDNLRPEPVEPATPEDDGGPVEGDE